jgi:hypothetical protein
MLGKLPSTLNSRPLPFLPQVSASPANGPRQLDEIHLSVELQAHAIPGMVTAMVYS